MTTLVLSFFIALLGPLGATTASAANPIRTNGPLFRVGAMDRWGYWGFINEIRRQVNVSNNAVPGSHDTIDHTPIADHGEYIDVRIQMWGNEHYVPIRLRRSDLYVIGWWSSDGVYNHLDTVAESLTPTTNLDENGRVMRDRNGREIFRYVAHRQTPFTGDYPTLEHAARATRSEIGFSREALSSAAWDLYNARHPEGRHAATETRLQAHAVLMMTQFISEATRFRGVANTLGWANEASADQPNREIHLPWQLVGEENNWGRLSSLFNTLLGGRGGSSHPDRAYTADYWGHLVTVTLYTLADYARVLNTAKGHP
ncbi:ribosome-inactivating family protein [Streptomyces sp. NBC_00490]|uniref:ribosome-inactivating family protein n=1 Tax=Streptomyces sp. NBC_00490 TaxID=2903657 RepID=UPI002E180FE8